MALTRKDFLMALGGGLVGVPVGGLAGRSITRQRMLAVLQGPEGSAISFAQSGEDLIVKFIHDYLKLDDLTYMEVGAYHPVVINNTYLFYLQGHRGVLVEPNSSMCDLLEKERPGDKVLRIGVGLTNEKEADFYLMSEPAWSTFSREEAEHQEKVTNKRIYIKQVRKVPLVNINDIMAEQFKGAPTYLSIDAEGIHFDIAKSIDYSRYRPKIICIETLVSGTNKTIPAIPEFLTSQGYVVRGATFPNTIFVDENIL